MVWRQADVLRKAFYWIEAPKDQLARDKEVRLEVKGNRIVIEKCDYPSVTLWLNDRIVNLDKPVQVEYAGKTLFKGRLQRSAALMQESLAQRNDPGFIFPARITVNL